MRKLLEDAILDEYEKVKATGVVPEAKPEEVGGDE
jgi:hypothetical protein